MFNVKETKIVEVETAVNYETGEVETILKKMVELFWAGDEGTAMDLMLDREFAEEFFDTVLIDTGFDGLDCYCYLEDGRYVEFNDLPQTLTNAVFEYFFTRLCEEVGREKEW